MTTWLAGMRITADRLNDYTPVPLTSVATAATGFTFTSLTARKAGGVTEFNCILSRTGADLTGSSSGNIVGDPVCCTLPPDCRPGSTYNAHLETSGVAAGSVRISSNGQCLITTLDPTAVITSGTTINFSGAFATG